jgi:hypothetical protein
VLLAGHMSTSSSLACYKRNYNSSYTASSKNSSAGSAKYASTSVIAVFIGILVFTSLWIVYCTLEQEEEEAIATAASWKQLDRNGLVITLPHDTPFKGGSSNFVVAGEEETNRVLLKKKKVFKVVEKELVELQASAAELHGPALQGMGQLFRRGRWAMSELLIAHLSESTSVEDLRLFLRSLHRSGVPARADVVLLFPWRPLPVGMAAMIDQEDESFRKLLLRSSLQRGDSAISRAPNSTSSSSSSSSSSSIISVFNAAAYWRSAETFFSAGNRVRVAEPVWGSSNINTAHSKSSSSSSSTAARKVHKDNWGGWGSVVGFDVQELDPGDTLRGILDDPPAELRRWVCYQILLGTLRHKYRNVLLTEAQGVFVLGDSFAPARRKSGSLFVFAHESRKWSDPASNILLSPGPPRSADDHQIHLQRELIEPGDHIVMMDPSEQQLEEGEEDMSGRLKILLLDSTEGKPKTGSLVMRMLMDSTTSSIRPLVSAGLIEEIYGTEIWNGLEKEDRDRKVLSTGIVMGGIRPVRSLANAMATEMVKVALKRKTRQPFHDEALLNFLIIRSSVLRQKVKSHLHIMVDSKDLSSSGVHLLLRGSSSSSSSSNHTSAAAVFFQKNGLTRYAIVQGCKAEEIGEERRKEITLALHIDICNSITATATTVATSTQVYSDCKLQF